MMLFQSYRNICQTYHTNSRIFTMYYCYLPKMWLCHRLTSYDVCIHMVLHICRMVPATCYMFNVVVVMTIKRRHQTIAKGRICPKIWVCQFDDFTN